MTNNIYGAVPRGEGWTVARIGLEYKQTRNVSNVRDFASFEEANEVAMDIAAGNYPDIADKGKYVNMR